MNDRIVWPFELDVDRVPIPARDGMTGELFRSMDQLVLAGQLQDMRPESDELVDPRFLSTNDALSMGAVGEHSGVPATEVLIADTKYDQWVKVRPAVAYVGVAERGHEPMDEKVRKEALEKVGGVVFSAVAVKTADMCSASKWSFSERLVIEEHAKWLVCGQLGIPYSRNDIETEPEFLAQGLKNLNDPKEVAVVAAAADRVAEKFLRPAKRVLNDHNEKRLGCPFPDLIRREKNPWRVRDAWHATVTLGRRFKGQALLVGMLAGSAVLVSSIVMTSAHGAELDGVKPYVRSTIDLSCYMRGGEMKKCSVRDNQSAGVRIDMKRLIGGIWSKEKDRREEREDRGGRGGPDDVYFTNGCEERTVELDEARLTFACDAYGEASHIMAELDRPADGLSIEYVDEFGKIVAVSGGDNWRMVTDEVFVNDDPQLLRGIMRGRGEQGVGMVPVPLER